MITNGNDISLAILNELKRTSKLDGKKMLVISVGDNNSANSYFKGICKKAEYLNVEIEHVNFTNDITQDSLISHLEYYNSCDNDAIMLLTPLPDSIDVSEVSKYISFKKDVDCLTVENIGDFYLKSQPIVSPCTALAVMKYFEVNKIDLQGKLVSVVGASNIVGKPVGKLLLDQNATVTICNEHTKNLSEITKKSDIVISCAGVAKLITDDMISSNAIVIDVGINFVSGKMCGDVDFDNCINVSENITPVPKGVGAVTSTIIFENMLNLIENYA